MLQEVGLKYLDRGVGRIPWITEKSLPEPPPPGYPEQRGQICRGKSGDISPPRGALPWAFGAFSTRSWQKNRLD
jgi:hypothetical protein